PTAAGKAVHSAGDVPGVQHIAGRGSQIPTGNKTGAVTGNGTDISQLGRASRTMAARHAGGNTQTAGLSQEPAVIRHEGRRSGKANCDVVDEQSFGRPGVSEPGAFSCAFAGSRGVRREPNRNPRRPVTPLPSVAHPAGNVIRS